jgi:hypothetical protein
MSPDNENMQNAGPTPCRFTDYTYGPPDSFPIIKTDINGNPLPGGYYALILPPVHGLITYIRVKPRTPREILEVILALSLSTARVAPEAGSAAAELASFAETATGFVEAGEAAAEIGAVATVTIEAEVMAAELEAFEGAF